MTITEFQKDHSICAQFFAKHESHFDLDLNKFPEDTQELDLDKLEKFGKKIPEYQNIVIDTAIYYCVFDKNGNETDFDSLKALKEYINNL